MRAITALIGLLISQMLSGYAQPPLEPVTLETAASLRPVASAAASGSGTPNLAAVRADGRLGVLGLGDETTIWDFEAGKPVTIIDGGRARALSTDGTRLVLSRSDGSTAVVSTVDGRVLFEVDEVFASLSSTGAHVITERRLDPEYEYTVWEVERGTVQAHFQTVPSDTTFAFSPDGRWLAWTSWQSEEVIWDVQAGAEVYRGSYITTRVGFTPDSTLALFAGVDFVSRRVGDGLIVGVVDRSNDFEAHGPMWFDRAGTRVFVRGWGPLPPTGLRRDTLALIDVETMAILALVTVNGSVTAGFSPNGRLAYILGAVDEGGRSAPVILNAQTGEAVTLPDGLATDLIRLSFLTEDVLQVYRFVAGTGYVIELWDAHAMTLLHSLGPLQHTAEQPLLLPSGRDNVYWRRHVNTLQLWAVADEPLGYLALPIQIDSPGITVRTAPSINADAIGLARQSTVATAHRNGYVYAPEHSGWLRTGRYYALTVEGLPFELLPADPP